MVRLPPYFIKQGLKESYKLFFFELARYNEFFVRTIPFRLMTADFNITDNCNSRCIACTCWKQKSHNELTTEEVNEILIQVKKIGIRSIGYVVEYKDQLQDAIVKTLSDGGLRRRFGEDRRRLVMEEFGWDKIVLDVEKIYLSVIER